jgi:hypothetical protein
LAIAPRLTRSAFAVLIVVGTLACDIPNFQGPQVQNVPPGFSMNPETNLERRMMPDLEVIHYDAWVEASWGDFSGIYINGHPGAASRDDAERARQDLIARSAGALIEFGEIEELTVDERTAWGWTEWWRLANGGLDYVVYRAVIPYDTVSYTVEFLTGDPALKIRPDSLRTIVASFGIGKTTWNVPLIAIMAGVLLLFVNTMRTRIAAKAARARGITLVHIPTKEEKKKAEEAAAAQTPGPGAGGAPGPSDSIAGSIAREIKKDPPPSSG